MIILCSCKSGENLSCKHPVCYYSTKYSFWYDNSRLLHITLANPGFIDNLSHLIDFESTEPIPDLFMYFNNIAL